MKTTSKSHQAKNKKPKFIPPISTAASFLRSISNNPDQPNFQAKRASILKEFVPEFPSKYEMGLKFLDSPTFKEKISISKSPRYTRDVSHLQDTLKESKSEKTMPSVSSIHILPTNPDHLKVYFDASERQSRCSSRGHLCNKEKCLEDFLDRSTDLTEFKKKNSEESNRMNLMLGLPSGKHDIHNLKDWYKYMKENYLARVVDEEQIIEKVGYEQFENDLNVMELVIRAGIKECTRQIKVQSVERGEVLEELIDNFDFFWKKKNIHIIDTLKESNKSLKQKIKILKKAQENMEKSFKEKENSYLNNIELIKSNALVKDVEIERLKENIKKLKAERTFRIKKELDTYNEMLRKFKEYREEVSLKLEENALSIQGSKKIQTNLRKARDSIKEMVLSKLKLIEKQNKEGLSEEQQIEHQMLTADEEFPFKDVDTQVNIRPLTKEKYASAEIRTEDVELETDELLDFISFGENSNYRITPQDLNPSIKVTNDKNQETLKFSSYSAEKPTAIFTFRLKTDKTTQTDNKIFLDTLKKEEEQMKNWMLQDRESYLRRIQKEILQKKSELNKVNALIALNKNQLGESMNMDEKLTLSFASSNGQNEEVVDNEIEHLKSLGVFTHDIDSESWKQGYYFGYDKGKIEGLAEGEKLGYEKAEFDKDLSESVNATERSSRKSIRKTTLAIEDFKRDRKITKIQEFHFSRKKSKMNTVKYEHKINLIEAFLADTLKDIVKNTKMSKKMTLKTISTIYSAASKKDLAHIENLADFTYEEFFARYSQESVANKKFTDFIAALLKYPDSRKVITFSKLLGISRKLGLEDYFRAKESFIFLAYFLQKIEKSSLGIIMGIDETSEYHFIPKIRAIECAKETVQEYMEHAQVQGVVEFIDKNSHPDPKKINKSGIIDQELLQEIMLSDYNAFNLKNFSSIWLIFESISLTNKPKTLYKLDFIMASRFISANKFEELTNKGDALTILNTFLKSNKEESYESTENLIEFCFKQKLLFASDTENFYSLSLSSEEIKKVISEGINEQRKNLMNIISNKEKFGISEEYSFLWDHRIAKLQENNNLEAKKMGIAWKLLSCEIGRLLKANEN